MFVIDDKIISTELFSQKFICNLSKCKGACCWEGDFGAPVTDDEVKMIEYLLERIKPIISEESRLIIEARGVATFNTFLQKKVTHLHEDGACVFLIKGKSGIARCAFEKLWEEGNSDFKKPLSCHLYPVRISENKESGFEALNYDEWDICSAACSLGEEHQTPVFRFVNEAIIRRYGQDFYDQMEDIYASYFA